MENGIEHYVLVNSMAMNGQGHAELFRSAIVCKIICEWNIAQTIFQVDDCTILWREKSSIYVDARILEMLTITKTPISQQLSLPS